MKTECSRSPHSEKLELHALLKMAALINSSLDPDDIRQTAVGLATSCVSADAASLFLLDQDTGELYFESVTGEKGQGLKQNRMQPRQGIAG